MRPIVLLPLFDRGPVPLEGSTVRRFITGMSALTHHRRQLR
jgi:hypothetical protein